MMFDPDQFAKITVPSDNPRQAAKHSDIKKIANDVFMVRGAMPSAPGRPIWERLFLRYSRTMTVVRHHSPDGGSDLTLINTMRLSPAGLEALTGMGRIRNIVRLGAFHGVDDAFYVSEFGADYWQVEGMQPATDYRGEVRTMSESSLPIPDAKLFCFEGLNYPEAILLLPAQQDRPGVAITTDSIQNHTSAWDPDNSFLVSMAIKRIGLLGPARLGPVWLRDQVPANKNAPELTGAVKKKNMTSFFRPQFQRLLHDFDFDMLVPGHGWPVMKDAKAAVRASIEKQLSD
ncbi:MAG: hypothetical protein JJ850_10990 [Kordiimonadaceae bacterium]|nr:hypothetical protein [Kordiimonadaceae bacterium]MBO6568889.1 hypothetical protein [Kordiimonadaceae bacterium]MBO6965136.1 hypothetical protein [Kordiimonadaceae bacterium]